MDLHSATSSFFGLFCTLIRIVVTGGCNRSVGYLHTGEKFKLVAINSWGLWALNSLDINRLHFVVEETASLVTWDWNERETGWR